MQIESYMSTKFSSNPPRPWAHTKALPAILFKRGKVEVVRREHAPVLAT